MAAAEGGSGEQRRRARPRPWAAVLCFGSRRGDETAAVTGTPRGRKKQFVPVNASGGDGVSVARQLDDREVRRGEEAGKASLLRRFCCFLPPARKPGLQGGGGNARQTQRQQEHVQQQAPPPPGAQNGRSLPREATSARRAVATTTTTTAHGIAETRNRASTSTATPLVDAHTSGSKASSAPRFSGSTELAARSDGARAAGGFGPAAGLSMVATVSVGGLLGGRLLASVVCVCAWFFALFVHTRRRRRWHDEQRRGGRIEASSSARE